MRLCFICLHYNIFFCKVNTLHIFVPQLHHDVVGKNAQLPHRGFQSFVYLQANGKICKRKKAFRRGYLAHKIETRCHTICTPWHYSRGTDGTKGLFQTQVSNAKTPCLVRNFLPIGQIFSFGRQFRWETYQQTAFRNIAIARLATLK